MSRLSLAAATAFLLMNTAAYAGPIPFAFSGTVTAVGETINSAFVPGDSFTGIFMFDDQSIVDDVSFVVDVPNDPITSVNLIYESPVQFFFGTLGGKYSFVSQAAVETHHARSASGAIDSGSTIVTSSRENFQPPYPLVGPSVNGLPPASSGWRSAMTLRTSSRVPRRPSPIQPATCSTSPSTLTLSIWADAVRLS